MADARALSDVDLTALISRGIAHAEDHDRTAHAARRREAMEYISGIMKDTPAENGRSSVVSRDVADTIGWILPGIMRVFTASDHFAKVDAVTQRDEAFAGQATDGINYVFLKRNPGYKIIYDATWDALAAGNGVVKVWWDETPEYETSFHSGLSDDQFVMLTEGDEVEVLAHSQTIDMVPMPDQTTGQVTPQPFVLHEVKIRRLKSRGRIRIEAIAPEDFGLDGAATCTDDAKFQFHRQEKTRSELIEMGFDRKKVQGLQAHAERDSGREGHDEQDRNADVLDSSVERVDLFECYFEADIDGDGVSEAIRAYYAGNKGGGTLLDWEVWEDETPFYDIPCGPIPHQWEAESISDETMDVQRIKTVLLRQALDNIYATNIPGWTAETGSVHNPDELFSPAFGGVLWHKPGSAPPQPRLIPFVADKAFAAIDYQDQVIQRRTGVNRQTAALDPEALVNQSATANQNERDASYSQIEQIARNMAELGWSRVFRGILRLMVKHQDRAETIRLRDKWVEIDPRHWNADMDVTINVGLGTGSRDRDLAMLNGIFDRQGQVTQMMGAAGLTEKALDMLPYMFTTLGKIAESAGIKTPEMFFPEIKPEELAPIKQQMAQAKAQGDPKAQMEQAKLQADMQAKAAQFQFDQQKLQIEQQTESARMREEFALKREQIAMELELKREQLAAEISLKRELEMERLVMQRELGMAGHAMKASVATSGVSVGGDPG